MDPDIPPQVDVVGEGWSRRRRAGFDPYGDLTIGVHTRGGVKKIAALQDRLLKKGLRAKGRRLDSLLLVVRKEPMDPRLERARISLEAGLGIPVQVIGWKRNDPPEPVGAAFDELLERIPATQT